MAHSWVQMFDSEYEAFKAYADIYPDNCVFLVDTYNVLKSGVPNAIRVAKELEAEKGIRARGIRLDSGDIAYLSIEARKMLDAAGFEDMQIGSVLFAGAMLYYARSLLLPVQQMSRGARRVADGEYDIEDFNFARSDEIGMLADSFNHLKHQIARTIHALESEAQLEKSLRQQESEAARLRQLIEQSRFAQLQSQINPHFLFNTLQSVANMAGIEQATVTGDMVVRLANFFRYTLDHDDSVVTLDRELALLRDYISLQELRFGERISFEMNCDSRCAACELPKFTLQPIVENSIVHGMRSRSAGGRIRIVTESTPNGCRIQITDNGGGFSRSKMKQNTAEGHRSIGLQNIAGRIALSGGSFRIVSCPGLGTTARIILPMKGEEHIC